MKDNRVLNNRPPSINDEETLLPRRQTTTLSQLRSGHCKLLNSYKKRLKQSDSSSCPDYGMDPQDVPHLFDCMDTTNFRCCDSSILLISTHYLNPLQLRGRGETPFLSASQLLRLSGQQCRHAGGVCPQIQG